MQTINSSLASLVFACGCLSCVSRNVTEMLINLAGKHPQNADLIHEGPDLAFAKASNPRNDDKR